MEVFTVGRKINTERKQTVLQAIKENNENLQAAGLAKLLNLHPQEVGRVLTALEDEAEKLVYEDDKGFLGFFRK
jgi:DNA-binding IclR family transcriptional regulator